MEPEISLQCPRDVATGSYLSALYSKISDELARTRGKNARKLTSVSSVRVYERMKVDACTDGSARRQNTEHHLPDHRGHLKPHGIKDAVDVRQKKISSYLQR